MNRPRNWYDMSDEQRRAWQRQAMEMEDLEYEKDRERQARENAEASAERLRREARAERASYQEEVEGLQDALRQAEEDLAEEKITTALLLASCVEMARLMEYVPDLTGIIKPVDVKARAESAIARAKGG
jgi:hypothetical protein